VQTLDIEESAGTEIQIGGSDVLSYGEMLDRMTAVLGLPHRPRQIQPVSFDEALRRAVAEDAELRNLAATPAGAS
jgi:hypothetical protein